MNPSIEKIIQKNGNTNRQFLLDLKKNKAFGKNVNVVYIYYLVGETINYPNKSGSVIYIGEAGRSSEPTGVRFSQHISTSENKGGDTGTIYCLSRYYWLGKTIKLKIFTVESETKRKNLERSFLIEHVKKYGALPICQGTTGENYQTSDISTKPVSEEISAQIT